MHAKQLKLSLMVLFGLIVLSYGFLISAQEGFNSSANIFSAADSESSTSMTKTVAQQITAITGNAGSDQQVSLDAIKNVIDNSLQNNSVVLPEISRADVKIKEQNYSKYSAAVAKEKEKEDAVTYTAGLFFIFNSNSPEPVTSISNMPLFFASLGSTLIPAISTGDTSSLDELSNSGEKILKQMKELEVPEKLVDTHIKGMQFAQYATTLKTTLASQNSGDPLGALSGLSKFSGYLESLLSFSTEASQTLSAYIPENDAEMAAQLEKYGIEAPLSTETETTTANDATTTIND